MFTKNIKQFSSFSNILNITKKLFGNNSKIKTFGKASHRPIYTVPLISDQYPITPHLKVPAHIPVPSYISK